MFDRPDHSEYAEFYRTYVDPLPDGDILAQLHRQQEVTVAYLGGLTEEQCGYRYEPGKWTPRQVIGHVMDAERVFSLRALWFARGDAAALPGFDHNVWVGTSNADRRPMSDLLDEYGAVRAATMSLFGGMAPEAATATGVASGAEISVRALTWIIAGHERHHVQILRNRYFPA